MNDLMKKHFANPKNMGKIKKPTHFVKYKSGFCGDTIELYVLVENGSLQQEIERELFVM